MIERRFGTTLTLSRAWERESRTPSPACGGRMGWGRNRTHVTPDFASTLALPRKRRREWEGVRADEVIR